jgi:hypothetical protein
MLQANRTGHTHLGREKRVSASVSEGWMVDAESSERYHVRVDQHRERASWSKRCTLREGVQAVDPSANRAVFWTRVAKTAGGAPPDAFVGRLEKADALVSSRRRASSAASTAPSCLTVGGLQAAALKPRIDPGGHFGPQTNLYGEQRVDFQAAQLPPLFIQLRERSPRRASEIVAQLFIRQQTADHSFDRSM